MNLENKSGRFIPVDNSLIIHADLMATKQKIKENYFPEQRCSKDNCEYELSGCKEKFPNCLDDFYKRRDN
jgi:hypothetical protein